ncbi:MAG TPA: hypothetical protein VFS24_09790 [Steroidobacteraceae bacterium]|nr:hypothetical protein [Steroidobacteraceae bacterium]
MPGSRDVYRYRPLLHPKDVLAEISDEWVFVATCLSCRHHAKLGRIKDIVRNRRMHRAGEFLVRLRCRRCGAGSPAVRAVHATSSQVV